MSRRHEIRVLSKSSSRPGQTFSHQTTMATTECSVCYGESGPFQKLCCGHVFCATCIKNWYLKGVAGSSCPMCRAPVYFKGFHAVRDQWNDDAWDTKCAEVFSDALDERFAEAQEFADAFPPKWRNRIFKELIDDFVELEKTYRYLRHEGLDPEDMEEVFYWGDYYSDRHMNKYWYLDEPRKETVPMVQSRGRGNGSPKRVRAREDPWVTVSLVYLI